MHFRLSSAYGLIEVRSVPPQKGSSIPSVCAPTLYHSLRMWLDYSIAPVNKIVSVDRLSVQVPFLCLLLPDHKSLCISIPAIPWCRLPMLNPKRTRISRSAKKLSATHCKCTRKANTHGTSERIMRAPLRPALASVPATTCAPHLHISHMYIELSTQ